MHDQTDDLTQLRHIVLESATALEHLYSLWVETGCDESGRPPPQRHHALSDTLGDRELQYTRTPLHFQDTLTGPNQRRCLDFPLHHDSNHALPAERQET